MSFKSFQDYRQLKEATESGSKKDDKADGGIGAKVSLGDGNDYEPFTVSDDPKSENYGKNKNLAPIVRAFKQGANWGWSKDDGTGEDKPVKITGKKLYLAGGAVRDHLVGKKPRNVELATSASPDEVYHILKQNDFEFVPDEGTKTKTKKSFWVQEKDKNDRPFKFGIKSDEDTYELEIFTKSPKGGIANPESGTQAEDAKGRDFTINGMYILLSNDNGPNKELNDFYGGMHHLKNGKIASIGDMGEKFAEDPKRIMRYVRMLSGYGDPKKVSAEEKEAVKKASGGLKKMAKGEAMKELKKGLDKDDVDARGLMMLVKDLGLLDQLFPGMDIDDDLPKELSEIGDKHMPLAWMLRRNDPKAVSGLAGLEPEDAKKICFLMKSLGLSEDIEPDGLEDLVHGFMHSGVSGRKLSEWGTKVGGLSGDLLQAFLAHAKSPRVKIYTLTDDGVEKVSDDFVDLIDPFTGDQDVNSVNERKRDLEHNNFHKQLEFMRPV